MQTEGRGGFGMPKGPTCHGRINLCGAAEHPALDSSAVLRAPSVHRQQPAGAEGAQHPWGHRLCFVYREFSSWSLLLSLISHPFPLQQHIRLTCATQSWQEESSLQKGLWTRPGWRQGRIQLGKNLTSPLPGRKAVCSPPMSCGRRCSGFAPCQAPKLGCCLPAGKIFLKPLIF